MMNIHEIRERVQTIRDIADDDEAAHCGEDSLWRDVLLAIAQGSRSPSELATEALVTKEIEFERWCA